MSDHPELDRAVMALQRGGLVAFPTETVYGLGVDATDDDALRRLYAVKGRPADHPVIVHLGADAEVERWAVGVTDTTHRLVDRFWPGPLTLVVEAAADVSRVATGGLDTVGLRVPNHPVALELLECFGGAIAAPSANRFGRVSPTTADAVVRDLGHDVDVVLDGGPCAVGVESTILDLTTGSPRVLRLGGVPVEALAEVLGAIPPIGGTTRAPGGLASHYAPMARVVLIESGAGLPSEVTGEGGADMVGVIGLHRDISSVDVPATIAVLAAPASVEEYAHLLYRSLREADDLGIDVVIAFAPPAEGLGAAIGDRLRRAAAGR